MPLYLTLSGYPLILDSEYTYKMHMSISTRHLFVSISVMMNFYIAQCISPSSFNSD